MDGDPETDCRGRSCMIGSCRAVIHARYSRSEGVLHSDLINEETTNEHRFIQVRQPPVMSNSSRAVSCYPRRETVDYPCSGFDS